MGILTAGVKMEKESKLGPLAMIIGSLTAILIAVITTRDFFPVYFIYVVVTFLLVAISYLTIHELLAPPICDFIKKRREIRTHNALAIKYFGEFEHFTEEFGDLLWQSRTVNIPYALRDSQSSQEFRLVFYPSTDDLREDYSNLLNCFKERLKCFDRTKEDFSLLVNEFDLILEPFNKHCIYNPMVEIKRIGRDKIKESFKGDYKKFNGGYELFLRNYTAFGKKLNKEFGEGIFRGYFKLPEEL